MKIGKLTRINDKGNIELASSLLNLNIRSSRHSAMIRQVESRTDRYSVWISSNKTGVYEYTSAFLKPKTVIGLLNKYNIPTHSLC